jgi:hypothetical protein
MKPRIVISVKNALEQYRGLLSKTDFCPRTNETYYPARWSYGDGAGDASTSRHGDCRKSLAAERCLAELAEEYDVTIPQAATDWGSMGSRDIGSTISAAINAAIYEDETADEDE